MPDKPKPETKPKPPSPVAAIFHADGVRRSPSRHGYRSRIDERNIALRIRGNDPVADTRQSHLEPLTLLTKLFALAFERLVGGHQLAFGFLARGQDALRIFQCRQAQFLFLFRAHFGLPQCERLGGEHSTPDSRADLGERRFARG